MIYVWVHGTIILFSKVKGTTQYESAVLIAGFVAFILYILGTINQ